MGWARAGRPLYVPTHVSVEPVGPPAAKFSPVPPERLAWTHAAHPAQLGAISPTPARSRRPAPDSRSAIGASLLARRRTHPLRPAMVPSWSAERRAEVGCPADRTSRRPGQSRRRGAGPVAQQIARHAQLHGEPVVPVGHTEPSTIGQLGCPRISPRHIFGSRPFRRSSALHWLGFRAY